MTSDEINIVVEIVCTNLPGDKWGGSDGPVHLGIQRDKEVIEIASAASKRVVFRPVRRARSNSDWSTMARLSRNYAWLG